MKINKGVIQTAQKVVVYGVEGIGKSTFASEFPEPLFSDTEGGTNALNVSRFETPTDWYKLVEQAQYVKNNRPCKTYVVDSIDWAERMCMQAICEENGKKSIEDFGYGKGYTVLVEWMQKYLDILQEIVDNGINVVLTAHAQIKKIERPDDANAYDRYELKLQKKTCPIVKEWADMLLFANYETYTQKDSDGKVKAKGKERMMYTTYNPVWDAKNRHHLPDELPFLFESIAGCIPVFESAEMDEKAKENNIKKAQEKFATAETEEEIIETKQDVIRERLEASGITEEKLMAFLNDKGLSKAKSLDEMPDKDVDELSARLDKIIDKLDDLPF